MKVVMIADSAADRKLYRMLLQEGFGRKLEFFEERQGSAGLETCRAVSLDCVLVNHKLPDMSGLEFLAQARKIAPRTAVVVITRQASEAGAIACVRAGAQDYLVMERTTAGGLKHTVERAIHTLAQDRRLRLKQQHLTQALGEQEALLKEVQHRVKNNLQVISSLLRMQSENSPDERLRGALQESLNRVESMSLIHEQLYESGDLGAVDLVEHATVLMTNLFLAYGVDPARISAQLSFDPAPSDPAQPNALRLGVDQAIPAGLILNELISNALKHAFPGDASGTIIAGGGFRNGEVELYVQDSGIGLPKKFDLAKPSGSLGLKIVTILARQLKGSLQVERGATGSTFRLRFPLAKEKPIGLRRGSSANGAAMKVRAANNAN